MKVDFVICNGYPQCGADSSDCPHATLHKKRKTCKESVCDDGENRIKVKCIKEVSK